VGNYAYVADGSTGLAIIDVSDPTSPGAPVYKGIGGYTIDLTVVGNYAYVATGASGLAIIDVSDPANPGTPVYKYTSGFAYGVTVVGNYAYVADGGSGLAIIDVSDPTSPGTPVYMDTSGYAYGVTVVGNYAYVTDRSSGLAIIDVSDPTSPGTPVYKNTSGYAYGVTVVGNYAYVGDYFSGLAIIDISDPTNPGAPVYMDTSTSGDARGVTVVGNYAYVADDTSGLVIIDISDKANPGAPVYVDTSGEARGVTVVGNYAYVADSTSGLAVIPLNTAFIQDAAGNNATLTLASPGATNSLGANKAIVFNNAPVAVANTLTVAEDAALTSTDVIANDTDIDGDTLSLTAATTAGTGTVAVNADGLSVDYTPAANFNGTEVITYTVSDGTLTDATGTLTVTVTAVNDAPVAVANTLTVAEDAALTSTDVIANDTDIDGDTLSLTAATTAGSGTVAVNADGLSVDYTPAANFNGTEVITYTVSDGTLTDATGTLTVTVTAVNDAPVAVANTLTVAEDAALTSTDVIANDTDIDGDTLSLTAATTAGSGTVVVDDLVIVDYTPAANFNGTEVITYTVSDGTLTDATGTLTVTVTAVNDAPVAVANTLTVAEDAALISTDVIANDTDIDGDTLSLTAATTAGSGTVAVNADGLSVDYTPAANFNGTEVITYTVSDGTLTDATGTLTVTVTAVNDAPVASSDSVTTIEDISLDVTLVGTDGDGDAITYALVDNPTNGTLSLTDNKATYVPNRGYFGTDSFTFKVNDGTVDSEKGTVSITVTSNDLDEDGILNDVDDCPNTPAGDIVDLKGCTVFTLPVNNNKVEVTSASCIGNADGSIGLSVEDNSFDYIITVTGKDDPIAITGENKTASVTGLSKGDYTLCFTVTGQADYEQCFEVTIGEPKALSAFIDVDNDNRTTTIQLGGSKNYYVDVNGERFKVTGDNFTTSLPTGLSIIKISTDLDCQGLIEREVFISEDIHFYPNPTPSDVNVHVGGEDTEINVSVFSEKGDLIYRREQQVKDMSRLTEIDLSLQITGTYLVVLESKTVRKTFKIVKK